MSGKTRVAFHTLGCKLNYAETATIESLFGKERYEHVPFSQAADIYVINTCSVTEHANKNCRLAISRAIRQSPAARVVVLGCFAQLKADEIARIPGVYLVLGTRDKFKVVSYLEAETTARQAGDVHSCEIDDVDEYEGSFSVEGRTRSFLKVQDGCDYNCSYCTIPLARGKSRNPRVDDIVHQAKIIEARGINEVILTGVNIGDFGRSTGETFFELMKALERETGIPRYRISSIEPNLLTDQMIEWVSTSGKFMPHFHIPLQSGSDDVLKLMRRRYNTSMFAGKIEKIRTAIPGAAIGIDVIVGTPGETEELFLNGYEFLKGMDFTYLHVFSYSPRENTAALAIEPKVRELEKKERSKQLHDLSASKHYSFLKSQIGRVLPVLFEKKNHNGHISGFTPNYVKVAVPFSSELVNRISRVLLTEVKDDVVVGNVV